MREYQTELEYRKDVIEQYDEWLKEHITCIDRLTGEVIVAVNKHTGRAISNLVKPVKLSMGYGWYLARKVYLAELSNTEVGNQQKS